MKKANVLFSWDGEQIAFQSETLPNFIRIKYWEPPQAYNVREGNAAPTPRLLASRDMILQINMILHETGREVRLYM